MDFGQAIKALKEGKALRREGWNDKDLFIVKQIPCKLEGLIIEKIQSLPESAKTLLKQQDGVPVLSYENQVLIINGKGGASAWSASSSDIFAEDWIVVE